nr:CBL-interacting serine/threonine-protein kinase 1 [Ipomoea batatas]
MMLTAIAVNSSADADAQIQTTLQLAAIRHSKSKQEVASCRPHLPSRSAIADHHFPPTVEFSCLFVNDDCHAKTPTTASTGHRCNNFGIKGKLPEVEGRKLFQQLIDGVRYCHIKGVFHRNLKLENVLVDENGIIKVTDFGLSALPQHFRDVSERKIRFKSNLSPKELLVRIENTVINMGFQVQRKNGKVSNFLQIFIILVVLA